jgi:AcrR family transcriptional regulator
MRFGIYGMTSIETRKRKRLAPEVRRSEILDNAARLSLEQGLSAVSMERLGRESAVSKALVYNYFPSREILLAALLHREQSDLDSRGMAQALEARSYKDLIRQTTRVYLEHTQARGALIQALLADPSIVRLMEAEFAAATERTVRFFVRATRREYGLSLSMAIASVELLMALTDRAGKQVGQGQISIDVAETMCVEIITGGLRKLADGSNLPTIGDN